MQLGELEKQVLQYLWNTQEADVKQVHAVLGLTRGISLNTIQSTLDRLFKKDLLNRTKQGHAYFYFAKVDRDALVAKLISNVTSDFVDEGEHSLIAAFSSASSNLDDSQLDKLEQLIEQQRQLRKGI
ncbi:MULTISPECIES: BlaI/MecI/CopY family transcriptional regulator [Chromatiaceae]|jgi:predicted transcriptional regulator|uniref:BlaI/MecI/CopY family transcriptional regulator n=1 Tax=Arsukibacterium indicum TaxID=2848612 RepID=A0ABS6MNC2_9GAMM|nr:MULTISPECIES: BlaI/MecI/CopY family transcriptional regulator [Chromatiaceae]MBV2130303.1 BlaI/MecI/CopY family transcriptional regulator [Arsukibacterium indicum]MCD1596765.1 BlaI/MecI/CopY family transcriptional regulator [Rheinheimera aquimaris]